MAGIGRSKGQKWIELILLTAILRIVSHAAQQRLNLSGRFTSQYFRVIVLDVVIGLTLIYTFLSLLSSELTEFFTTVWRWRAKHLQQGIITLLGESLELRRHPEQFKNTITGKLYYSSLIASITQRSRRGKRPIDPAYIPSNVFADALLEVLQGLPDIESKAPQMQQDVHESMHTLTALLAKVESSPELPPRLKDNLKRLAKRTQAQTEDAEQQLEQFRQEIALWFEQSPLVSLVSIDVMLKSSLLWLALL